MLIEFELFDGRHAAIDPLKIVGIYEFNVSSEVTSIKIEVVEAKTPYSVKGTFQEVFDKIQAALNSGWAKEIVSINLLADRIAKVMLETSV